MNLPVIISAILIIITVLDIWFKLNWEILIIFN